MLTGSRSRSESGASSIVSLATMPTVIELPSAKAGAVAAMSGSASRRHSSLRGRRRRLRGKIMLSVNFIGFHHPLRVGCRAAFGHVVQCFAV